MFGIRDEFVEVENIHRKTYPKAFSNTIVLIEFPKFAQLQIASSLTTRLLYGMNKISEESITLKKAMVRF